MKKLISIVIVCLVTVIAFAQKDVTQFMGIPIDGSETNMRYQLQKKGFKTLPYEGGMMEGQFNGHKVYLGILTNHQNVCEIVVVYVDIIDEFRYLKDVFNGLIRQFSNNQKYQASPYNREIPDDEDISYTIKVHNLEYEAHFFQKNKYGEADINRHVWLSLAEEDNGACTVCIFYENRYNIPQGEDL